MVQDAFGGGFPRVDKSGSVSSPETVGVIYVVRFVVLVLVGGYAMLFYERITFI